MTQTDDLGGRLPLFDPDDLTKAQQDLYDELQSSWVRLAESLGVQAAAAGGSLIGPFNAFLLHPEVAQQLWNFQAAEQDNSTLPTRVREVVILVVGAVWGAAYELYAHVAVGRQSGLSEEMIATLEQGGIPDDLTDEEKLAARLATELATTHRVDDALYRQAERAFGAQGLFDIVAVMGVYQTVCPLMTLFEIPAPSAA